jgi:uracil-DNA glycosylase family 4
MIVRSGAKARALSRIAEEIARCPVCKKGCTGRAVPGEGSAEACVVFIGEAPGREEARTARPFVGRSGRLLREMIRDIGLAEEEVFITSPVHYLPLRGTPSIDMVRHGREHLFRQLAVIDPPVIVLLGATASRAVLDRKVEVAKLHGSIARSENRACFITLHPAYALRFPRAKEQMQEDFRKLRRLLRSRRE